MIERSWMRWLNSSSDNRKSKIPRSKIGGVSCNRSHTWLLELGRGAAAGQDTEDWVSRSRFRFALNGPSFQREFRKLGYVEGKNIAFEYRYADNKLDRLPALAEELVRLKVDVIITPGTSGSHGSPRTLPGRSPSFSSSQADPVAAGLVDSLAQPGGNITGFTNIAPVLAGKRLELLKETVPKLSTRCSAVGSTESEAPSNRGKKANCAARELGLQLHSMEVSSADKFESAFKEAIKARSTALA